MPIISIFNSLRVPFVLLPLAAQLIASVGVTSRRLSTYLLLPEKVPVPVPPPSDVPYAPLLAFEDARIGWRNAPVPELPARGPKTAAKVKTATAVPVRAADHKAEIVTDAKVKIVTVSTTADAQPTQAPPASPPSSPPEENPAAKATPTTRPRSASGDPDGDTSAGSGPFAQMMSGLELAIQPGQLVAIVGPIGSGKSSVLSGAWGEATMLGGRVFSAGDVGIVPQRAFTISGTILDNILMGRPLNQQRFEEVWGTACTCIGRHADGACVCVHILAG